MKNQIPKHTPAPWTFDGRDNKMHAGGPIGTLSGFSAADYALIASAPTLHDTLCGVRAVLVTGFPQHNSLVHDMVLPAIDKALGVARGTK